MRRRRLILSAAAAYLATWALTATLGVSSARAAADSPSNRIRAWDGYSPMPCLVVFTHENFSTAWTGSYLWLFGFGRLIDHRMTRHWYPVF